MQGADSLEATVRIHEFSNISQRCGCSSVDRVLASEAKGRGFDPRQPHQVFALFAVAAKFAANVLLTGH